MKKRCYNFVAYSINGNSVYEGYALENINEHFEWCYYNRSERSVLETFENERDSVSFSFKQITLDDWAKKNLVGLFKSDELNFILKSLKKRNISYETDHIHYQKNDWRTRIFVLGCDIKKVLDLIKYTY